MNLHVLLCLGLLLLLLGLYCYKSQKREKQTPNRQRTAYQPDRYAEEELHFLRTQMNSHFLFNSLNTIKLLIQQTRNEEAVDYLVDFSKLVRGIVNNSEKRTIRLKEELELAHLFISLENLRYKKKIAFSIEVSDKIDPHRYDVPPMLLRPYLEKIIWRNRLIEGEVGQVKILVDQDQGNLRFIIEDDGISQARAQRMVEDRKKSAYFIERGVYDPILNKEPFGPLNKGDLKISEKLDDSSPTGNTRLIITLLNSVVRK